MSGAPPVRPAPDEPHRVETDDPAGTEGAGTERAVSFLSEHPLFRELPAADLRRLARHARARVAAAGEVLFREGDPGDGLYLIVSGELSVTRDEGSREVVLARRGPGDILGEMSLLERAPRSGTVSALEPSEVLVIDPAAFHDLITGSPEAAASILRTMAGRLRSTEALLMQQEKLAALGTLAAGLAHELNNPASAIQRSSEQLGHSLDRWHRRTAALCGLRLSAAQSIRLSALEEEAATCSLTTQDPTRSSLEEDDLAAWLDGRGVESPWEVAPPLVAYGWTADRLREALEGFDAEYGPVIIGWLATALSTRQLRGEIQTSADAISGIVRSVLSYTRLDQAPVQNVDVRESVEATLVILRHALKHGIEVTRDYDPDLPRVEAYASELSQVWTNLIDNAVAAMDGQGTLELATRRDGRCVVVTIADSGSGIPEDTRKRIFEPFFTTKAPGVGSGLGLHIVHNIVVARHGGRITVQSRPGRTVFEVWLPVRQSGAGK